MTSITIETPDGRKGEFITACGLVYSKDQSKHFRNGDLRSHTERMKDLAIRPDDVYLATYPKSGTHWVWEIIMMLLGGKAAYEINPKEAVFLDFRDVDIIDKVKSPRVLNCHWPCKLTPKGVFEEKIKIVHVQRNPKDMAVSLFHHHKNLGDRPFTKSFQEYLPMVLGKYGIYQFYPWFKYIKEWERFTKANPEQILNLFYEDIKEDPVREIRKIDILGTSRTIDLIKEIAHACHFDNLKQADLDIKVKEGITNHRKPSVMYRKGQVGDWKNHFTVAQNEEMNEWLNDNLVETDIRFRYTI